MPKINSSRFNYLFSHTKLSPTVSSFFQHPKKLFFLILNILLIVIISIFLWQIYQVKFPKSPSSSPQSSPSPSPCIPARIPTGKQTASLSHGKNVVGPRIQEIIYEPFDPELNQILKITATIKNDSPITKAIITLITDHKSSAKEMNLIDGDFTNGTWSVEIKVEDTYLCTYKLNFDLQSETGNYKEDMVFRQ